MNERLHDQSFIADWSVENVNPDVTPHGMLLDVSVLPTNRN